MPPTRPTVSAVAPTASEASDAVSLPVATPTAAPAAAASAVEQHGHAGGGQPAEEGRPDLDATVLLALPADDVAPVLGVDGLVAVDGVGRRTGLVGGVVPVVSHDLLLGWGPGVSRRP